MTHFGYVIVGALGTGAQKSLVSNSLRGFTVEICGAKMGYDAAVFKGWMCNACDDDDDDDEERYGQAGAQKDAVEGPRTTQSRLGSGNSETKAGGKESAATASRLTRPAKAPKTGRHDWKPLPAMVGFAPTTCSVGCDAKARGEKGRCSGDCRARKASGSCDGVGTGARNTGWKGRERKNAMLLTTKRSSRVVVKRAGDDESRRGRGGRRDQGNRVHRDGCVRSPRNGWRVQSCRQETPT